MAELELEYGTTRTTPSLLERAREATSPGESLRFWREGSTWGEERWPLVRVYSAAFSGSGCHNVLLGSSKYRRISQGDLEDAVDLPAARSIWNGVTPRGRASNPTLLLLAGPPLSGKTTLGRALLEACAEPTLLIENDAVRNVLVNMPKFSAAEHRRVYNTSWELTRLGLQNGQHVILDATNRDEIGRQGAYQAGQESGSRVGVVFTIVRPEVIRARLQDAPPTQRRASRRIGHQTYVPARCSVPHWVCDTSLPTDALVAQLASSGVPLPILAS